MNPKTMTRLELEQYFAVHWNVEIRLLATQIRCSRNHVTKKLRGVFRLLSENHEPKIAEYHDDILKINGEVSSWDFLTNHGTVRGGKWMK